eukprot:1159615-Pelagomonas_calceolata.AAC.7
MQKLLKQVKLLVLLTSLKAMHRSPKTYARLLHTPSYGRSGDKPAAGPSALGSQMFGTARPPVAAREHLMRLW